MRRRRRRRMLTEAAAAIALVTRPSVVLTIATGVRLWVDAA